MTERWVLIAPEREVRPSDFITQEREAPGDVCPFCPGQEALTPPAILSAPEEDDWKVRVIPNRFPAVRVEEPLVREAAGLYDVVSGFGAHEVIVETQDHRKALWDIPEEERALVLQVYRDRLADLANDKRLRWAMIFKNKGAQAGATLLHEHSQLLALPMIPREPMARWRGATAHFERTERCVYCDIISQEMSDGVRVVEESRFFIALCPFASRVSFETWILPKSHDSHYSLQNEEHAMDLSRILGSVLTRLEGALERPGMNFMLYSAPLQERATPKFHWHLEIAPAVQRFGGFERGSGYTINPTAPEDAARFLATWEGA